MQAGIRAITLISKSKPGIVLAFRVGLVGERKCIRPTTESKRPPLSRGEFCLNFAAKDLRLEPIVQMNFRWLGGTLIKTGGGLSDP